MLFATCTSIESVLHMLDYIGLKKEKQKATKLQTTRMFLVMVMVTGAFATLPAMDTNITNKVCEESNDLVASDFPITLYA